EFLRRLLAAPAPSALLLDRGFADTGEEVKLYTRGDRVIALGKKVVPEAWDIVGEGVGFFKCGAEAGPAFVRFLERVLEENQGMNEYEDALHMLVTSHHAGRVDATAPRWTQIGFAGDLPPAHAAGLPSPGSSPARVCRRGRCCSCRPPRWPRRPGWPRSARPAPARCSRPARARARPCSSPTPPSRRRWPRPSPRGRPSATTSTARPRAATSAPSPRAGTSSRATRAASRRRRPGSTPRSAAPSTRGSTSSCTGDSRST